MPSAQPQRQDAPTEPLDEWLASAFAPGHLDQTITPVADAQPVIN
ncbi:hypothetical protein ACFYPX_08385 [Micromonospora zamorensis]